VLTLEGMRISAITRFMDSGLLPYFGLPRTLPRHQLAEAVEPVVISAPAVLVSRMERWLHGSVPLELKVVNPASDCGRGVALRV
jgi:hypothetical protein